MNPTTYIILFNPDQDFVDTYREILEKNEYHILFVAPTIQDLERELESHQGEVRNLMSKKQRIIALIENWAPWKPDEESDYLGVGIIAENRIRTAYGNQAVTCIALTTTDHSFYGELTINITNESEVVLSTLSNFLKRKEK